MDGALRAEELGEHLDDLFVEGANVGKIRTRLQWGGFLRKPATSSYSMMVFIFEGMDGIALAKWGQLNN
jgi:hypothetical protein